MAWAGELSGIYIPEEMPEEIPEGPHGKTEENGRNKPEIVKNNKTAAAEEEAKTVKKETKPEKKAKPLPQAGEAETPENPVVPYDNQVVITEAVTEHETWVETRGVDLNNDELTLLVPKNLYITDIKPGTVLKVSGQRKENKVKVMSLEKVVEFEPPATGTPAEAPALTVKIVKEIIAGRDTLPDGKIKENVWTYAEDENGNRHVLAFYIDEEVAKAAITLKPGDVVKLVKVETTERKGKPILYGKEIEIVRKEEKAVS